MEWTINPNHHFKRLELTSYLAKSRLMSNKVADLLAELFKRTNEESIEQVHQTLCKIWSDNHKKDHFANCDNYRGLNYRNIGV